MDCVVAALLATTSTARGAGSRCVESLAAAKTLKQLPAPPPPDISLHETESGIDFIAGVRKGFTQLDRGDGSPIEEVEKLILKWAGK